MTLIRRVVEQSDLKEYECVLLILIQLSNTKCQNWALLSVGQLCSGLKDIEVLDDLF